MSPRGTILVVDDEPMLREIFVEILSDCSYQVFTAGNGREALELLMERSVDLLLSDINMPEIDGYELAAKVTELYPEIKIQLMSGYSEADTRHLVAPELYQSIIAKPIDPVMLVTRVNEHLA